jgi:hypothetical protein
LSSFLGSRNTDVAVKSSELFSKIKEKLMSELFEPFDGEENEKYEKSQQFFKSKYEGNNISSSAIGDEFRSQFLEEFNKIKPGELAHKKLKSSDSLNEILYSAPLSFKRNTRTSSNQDTRQLEYNRPSSNSNNSNNYTLIKDKDESNYLNLQRKESRMRDDNSILNVEEDSEIKELKNGIRHKLSIHSIKSKAEKKTEKLDTPPILIENDLDKFIIKPQNNSSTSFVPTQSSIFNRSQSNSNNSPRKSKTIPRAEYVIFKQVGQDGKINTKKLIALTAEQNQLLFQEIFALTLNGESEIFSNYNNHSNTNSTLKERFREGVLCGNFYSNVYSKYNGLSKNLASKRKNVCLKLLKVLKLIVSLILIIVARF